MRQPTLPVLNIRDVYFKNPFAVLPATTPHSNPNGRVTPELLMHYKALAQSEAALVIAGPATVLPPVSRKYSLLRVDQPKYLDGLRALTKIISSKGSVPGIQVVYPGQVSDPAMLYDRECAFSDDLAELTEAKVTQAFRNACTRSVEVGFKYIELCADRRMLLEQLISKDQEDMVRAIFQSAMEAKCESAALGLRINTLLPNWGKYCRIFLELGGDLLSQSEDPDQNPLDPENNFKLEVIHESLSPEAVFSKTDDRRTFIGMPVHFPNKEHQVLSCFRHL